MKTIDKICGIISKAFGIAAALFVVVIVVTCFIQAFTRYFMGHALSWSEEAARYSFAWSMLLASVSCCYARTHSGVTLLNDLLKGKPKHFHQALIDAAFALFGVLMLVYGVELAVNQSSVISPLLHVPMWAVYGAIPVSGAGIILMSLNNVLQDFAAAFKKSESAAAADR